MPHDEFSNHAGESKPGAPMVRSRPAATAAMLALGICLAALIAVSSGLASTPHRGGHWLVRFVSPLPSDPASTRSELTLEVWPGTRVRVLLGKRDITGTFHRSGDRLRAPLPASAVGTVTVNAAAADGRRQVHLLHLTHSRAQIAAIRRTRFRPSAWSRYDGRILQITRPADYALVKSRSIQVRLRVKPGTRRVRAFIDGREVTRALHRGAEGFTGTLPLGRIKPGLHTLLVTSRLGRSNDGDARTLFVAARPSALVTLHAAGTSTRVGPALPVLLLIHRKLVSLAVRLNGHDASRGLWPFIGTRRDGQLSPNEGLRFGRNVLRVTAYAKNGDYSIQRRVINVPRTRPLAGTQSNQQTNMGGEVRLDASSSRSFKHGDKLRFRWLVFRGARTSAALQRSTSKVSFFRPQKPGLYTAQLKVSETAPGQPSHQVSSSDTLTFDVGAPDTPIGWSVNTLATQDRLTGISYNGNFAANPGNPGSLQILAFSRSDLTSVPTPAPDYDLSTGAGVQSLISDLKTIGSNAIVILAGGASMTSDTLPMVNTALAEIGVGPLPTGSQGVPFSAVGILGAQAGSMFLNPRGGITGYLTQGFQPSDIQPTVGQPLPKPTDVYTFVYGNYQPFSISSGASNGQPYANVQLGSQNFHWVSSTPNAMYALVADSQTFTPYAEDTFDVNDANPATAASEINRLTGVLNSYANNPSVVVILQSVGTLQAYTGPAWANLALALEKYGATPHVVDTINGGYSFFGGAGFTNPPAETSTSLSGLPTAQIQGVLGLSNKDSSFQPVLHDPLQIGQGFNYGLLPVAYQPTQPWPNANDPSYTAAYNWISPQLGEGDIRTAYWREALTSTQWLEKKDKLTGQISRDCPADNPNFTQAVCRAEAAELAQEVGWVINVQGWFGDIEQPLNWAGNSSYADLNAALGNVIQSVEPGGSTNVNADNILDILSEGFDLLSYVSGDTADPVIGILGALTGAASPLTVIGDGTSTLVQDLQYKASQLGVQLENSYINTFLADGQIEAIILSDYGKLSFLGSRVEKPRYPNWNWTAASPDSTGDAVAALQGSATRWSYGELVPSAWGQWSVPSDNPDGTPVTPLNPQHWICSDDNGPYFYPLNPTPNGWFLAELPNASSNPTGVAPVMWMLGDNNSHWYSNYTWSFPNSTLTDAMNASFYDNQLLQAQFWSREFDPQSIWSSAYTKKVCDF